MPNTKRSKLNAKNDTITSYKVKWASRGRRRFMSESRALQTGFWKNYRFMVSGSRVKKVKIT